MNTHNYSTFLTDQQSKVTRTTESIIQSGGWAFKQVDTYTVSSPLNVVESTPSKLIIPSGDTGYQVSHYLDIEYDPVNHKFITGLNNDLLIMNIRMKCIADAQAGHLDVKVESPSFLYNPLNAYSFSFVKGMSQEHFFSPTLTLFIGQEVQDNGFEIILESIGCDVQVYDYSFIITRPYADGKNTDRIYTKRFTE